MQDEEVVPLNVNAVILKKVIQWATYHKVSLINFCLETHFWELSKPFLLDFGCFGMVSATICFENKTEPYPWYQIATLGSDQITADMEFLRILLK